MQLLKSEKNLILCIRLKKVYKARCKDYSENREGTPIVPKKMVVVVEFLRGEFQAWTAWSCCMFPVHPSFSAEQLANLPTSSACQTEFLGSSHQLVLKKLSLSQKMKLAEGILLVELLLVGRLPSQILFPWDQLQFLQLPVLTAVHVLLEPEIA